MIKRLVGNFIDILYPKTCHLCHHQLKSNHLDNLICMDCWLKIKKNQPPFCLRCGRSLSSHRLGKNICVACQRLNFHFDRALSPCAYEGVLKELISQFKYQGKDYLSKTLSRLLLNFIEEYDLPFQLFDLVMPVPLHKRKLREREFNQARLLSEELAAKLKLKLTGNGLIRIRDTATQTELNERERWINMQGSFTVKEEGKLKGKNILLIDDVLTTGATCSEAARVLKKAGCGVVFVLTVAN